MENVNIGIIGAGASAEAHLQAYAADPRVHVSCICDLSPERLTAVADKYRIKKRFVDFRSVLADPAVDLVDICLPPYLHYECAMEAFSAEKDVILEKPISLSIEDGKQMIEEAEKCGRKFYVVLNQRFLPCHRKAKELLDQGAIGKPFLVLATVIGDELSTMGLSHHWKGTFAQAGGGALADTGTHIVDLLHYFFGVPESVFCSAVKNVVVEPCKADDNVVVVMEFSNNIIANITITYTATGDMWHESKQIYGSHGSIHITNENIRPFFKTFNKGQPECVDVPHFQERGFSNWWLFSIHECLSHFIGCYLNNVEAEVTPGDALQALRIILDAYESSKLKRKVNIFRYAPTAALKV